MKLSLSFWLSPLPLRAQVLGDSVTERLRARAAWRDTGHKLDFNFRQAGVVSIISVLYSI